MLAKPGRSICVHCYRYTEWTVAGSDFQVYELYDRREDPGENINVVNDPRYATAADELKHRLERGPA